jgi:hypothetical protein
MRRATFLLCFVLCATPLFSEEKPQQPTLSNGKTAGRAFAPGEKLTYSLSWSNFFNVGTSVMAVSRAAEKDGKDIYRLTCSTRSNGMLESLFPVRVEAESIVRAHDMRTYSFSITSDYGGKKRKRSLEFNHEKHIVVFHPDDDPIETHDVPVTIQDALSSLYYVRTHKDFIPDKPLSLQVFEKSKIWPLDVLMLGKERIKTVLGEFDTIKISTHPLYEGVFPNKGAIDIWVTDDARKIPIIMKSRVTLGGVGVGSVVATLIKIETEKAVDDVKDQSKAAQ